MLKRVASGGQNGSDIAGVATAKKFGYETGGWMPKGFKTLDGPRPEYATLYGMKEHDSPYYPPRTYLNVQENDATLRFAFDFSSAGELLTAKAIKKYNKPYLDINVNEPLKHQEVVDWLLANKVESLNIAGNSEKTFGGMNIFVSEYLTEVFEILKHGY